MDDSPARVERNETFSENIQGNDGEEVGGEAYSRVRVRASSKKSAGTITDSSKLAPSSLPHKTLPARPVEHLVHTYSLPNALPAQKKQRATTEAEQMFISRCSENPTATQKAHMLGFKGKKYMQPTLSRKRIRSTSKCRRSVAMHSNEVLQIDSTVDKKEENLNARETNSAVKRSNFVSNKEIREDRDLGKEQALMKKVDEISAITDVSIHS